MQAFTTEELDYLAELAHLRYGTGPIDWEDFWDIAEDRLDRDLGTDLLDPELVRAKKYIRKALKEMQ